MIARRADATITDVARAAGVSRQTVSNALNAAHRVAPATLARVVAAIEDLGYRPDSSARSLRTGSRYTLAYPVPPDDPARPNALMSGFLHRLVDAADQVGYRVLLFRADRDARRSIADLVADRQVDGFVLSDVLDADPRVAELTAAGVPFAAFGRLAAPLPQDWVDVDNAAAMAGAVAALADRGHRRLAYLGAAEDLPWMRARRDAFLAAARDRGLTVAEAPLAEALRSAEPPTGLVAGDDWLALDAYRALGAAGLVPGRDAAVIGFNDLPVCEQVHPPLSSLRLPMAAIARTVVATLLSRLAGAAPAETGTVLRAELVLRASV